MSDNGDITFLCPACQVKLTVPGHAAGITGPCPACQVLIQAPFPAPAPPYQAPPPPRPLYSQPSPPPAEAGIVRPEPRQLPNRSEPAEAATRPRPEPSGDRPTLGRQVSPTHRPHRSPFVRVLVPLSFLGIAAGVVYGVMTVLHKDPGAEALEITASGEEPTKVRLILPEEGDVFEALTAGKSEPAVEAGEPLMPEIGGTDGDVEPGSPPVDRGNEALDLLEKFLAMQSLEERLPHLESKLPEADLAESILNGPLPEVLKIDVDVRETNSIEQVIDYFYLVDFAQAAGGVDPQTMLVRTRGGGAPRVVVDPFLDLHGGRFARYAANPTEEAGTFQVIISAGAFCYDDVPSPDKKFTLKILSREDTQEIAKAYFGKRSKIGDMLADETSGLAYGQAKPCTVFMRWNMEEDPQKPFLEALDIKVLNWNP